MSAQLSFPLTLYGSQAFSEANTSELLCISTCGLCTHDEIIDRSDDDHHEEFERCPRGDRGDRWLSWEEDFDGKAESAKDMKIFFMHLTISSDSWLGWSQRPLVGIPLGSFLKSEGCKHMRPIFLELFISTPHATESTVFWYKNPQEQLVLL